MNTYEVLFPDFLNPTTQFNGIEVKSPLDFIQNLKDAMSFNGRFYTASHYLQRDRGNFFALFFMTSNLKGLEKFLETKWEVDPIQGQDYKMPSPKGPGLFDMQFNEIDKDARLQTFAKNLEAFMKNEQQSDSEVYKFTLQNEFIPEHTISILREWQANGVLDVWDIRGNKPARKGSFNINYGSTKPAESKFTFNLKS